ncbi:superoxide dismutase [Candidatus Pacearchaeota archaeon RBG_16_35_8]|nr:MAG: superoxide dismutase [Candidatus Pacearchaeota archaeon RBG_16_35_8]
MMFNLPSLPYAYNSLEPYIDEQTMRIHHTKHHQAYVDKLNAALENAPQLQKMTAENLIKNINKVPEAIRTQIRNHGGGHLNHSFFWKILRKEVEPIGEILEAIEEKYGSFDKFKEQFKEACLTLFGSGWVWLVVNARRGLEIVKSPNQDNPLSDGKTPILGIDLWEHAYYLKYQNKRADYVEAFFNVIDWEKVNEFYVGA